MKLIKETTEDVMVLEFLVAELNSPRFGSGLKVSLAKIGVDENLIRHADLNNHEENFLRKKILKDYRGYNDHLLFKGFPKNIKWFEVTLSNNDFKKIKYIDENYWNGLSGGTRKVIDSINRIHDNIEIFGQSNEQFKKLANITKTGFRTPKVILVASDKKDDLVILEGHTRLTALALIESKWRDQLEAIVGFSPEIKNWVFY